MIFARKSNKIPEFYMIYARKKLTKCPNFTYFCPKNILSRILGGKCPSAPSPTPMAGRRKLYRLAQNVVNGWCVEIILTLNSFRQSVEHLQWLHLVALDRVWKLLSDVPCIILVTFLSPNFIKLDSITWPVSHRYHKSWAQCPLMSDACFTIFCQLLRSSAKWLSSCRYSPHHSTISSVHSLCGRPLLFLSSIFPKNSIFSFLSSRHSAYAYSAQAVV